MTLMASFFLWLSFLVFHVHASSFVARRSALQAAAARPRRPHIGDQVCFPPSISQDRVAPSLRLVPLYVGMRRLIRPQSNVTRASSVEASCLKNRIQRSSIDWNSGNWGARLVYIRPRFGKSIVEP